MGTLLLKLYRESHEGPEKADSSAAFLKGSAVGSRQMSWETLCSQRPITCPSGTNETSEPPCGICCPQTTPPKKITFPRSNPDSLSHLVISSFKKQLSCALFYVFFISYPFTTLEAFIIPLLSFYSILRPVRGARTHPTEQLSVVRSAPAKGSEHAREARTSHPTRALLTAEKHVNEQLTLFLRLASFLLHYKIGHCISNWPDFCKFRK